MNKSDFKVGKKVYTKYSNEVLYMYSLSQNNNCVNCTKDSQGHGSQIEIEYKNISFKPSKEQREAERKFKHSESVVNVFRDVEDLLKLFKDNPTYKDKIIELMSPYVGNTMFWQFVLHTTADEPKLHKSIKQFLTETNE